LRNGVTNQWILPKTGEEADRPRDKRLYREVVTHPLEEAPLILSRGSLIGGPNGLALSSDNVLIENKLAGEEELKNHQKYFGIRKWLVFTSFPSEETGHADIYARFLSPRLLTVVKSQTNQVDSIISDMLIAMVRKAAPEIEIVEFPLRSDGSCYASPLNWLQFGDTILVPDYPLTTDKDKDDIARALASKGFKTVFIYGSVCVRCWSLVALGLSALLRNRTLPLIQSVMTRVLRANT
jgi:hypothetical protein